MNRIVLRSMTEDEYLYWRELSVEDYANKLFTAGLYDEDAATDKARREFDAILTNGLSTPYNYIYVAENNKNEKVGHIWYKTDNGKAFINELEVYYEYRGMGYSKMILSELEKIVKNHSINMIYLHVSEQNKIAIDLYENMGYERFDYGADKEDSLYIKKNI